MQETGWYRGYSVPHQRGGFFVKLREREERGEPHGIKVDAARCIWCFGCLRLHPVHKKQKLIKILNAYQKET